MKRILIIWCVLLAYIPYAGSTDTIRLNMQAFLDEYHQDADGKWEDTYDAGQPWLFFEEFAFSHMTYAMQAQGTDENGMRYWDGFTLCTNGDDTDYGMAGSSTSWPEHQWGCMAGGGLDSTGALVKGAPYLVAYWGYNYENGEEHGLQVNFTDEQTHRPLGVWICNHPWAYYGIQHDDGFAHSFADNGAQFNLIIHGLDEEAKEAGMPIVHHLAYFHDNALDISSEWQWVDLSSLGQVNAVYFTMESSDVSGVLGMNTAAYFCLGGMEILEHVDEIPRPSGLVADPLDENRVQVTWHQVSDAAYYRVYVDSVLVDSTTTTSYMFTDLETYTTYKFFAQAVSAYGESSDWGYVSARTKDLTPPTPPLNVRATEVTMYKIVLEWDAGTDNIAVEKYAVYVDGKRYSRPKYTTVSITGLDPATTYQIELETLDTSGNASERVALEVTTLSITTGIEETKAEENRNTYTLEGRKINGQPVRGQVSIIQTGQGATKQIIQ